MLTDGIAAGDCGAEDPIPEIEISIISNGEPAAVSESPDGILEAAE
jgi:hypothetical protein